LVMNLGISGVSLSSQSKSLVDQNDKSDVKEAKSNQENNTLRNKKVTMNALM
jgi:hypothetical protein